MKYLEYFQGELLVCSLLLRSLLYLLINVQEAVYIMLTHFDSLGKKPKHVYGTFFDMLIKRIFLGTTMNITQQQTTVN